MASAGLSAGLSVLGDALPSAPAASIPENIETADKMAAEMLVRRLKHSRLCFLFSVGNSIAGAMGVLQHRDKIAVCYFVMAAFLAYLIYWVNQTWTKFHEFWKDSAETWRNML